MINYSTEFPIDEKNSVQDVMRLACKWIAGSPHSEIPESALEKIPENSDLEVVVNDERVTLAVAMHDDHDIAGLRYVRTESKGLEWTTSIVALKKSSQHILSVQVSCEALNTAVSLPPPKKPYFIRQAITALGGGSDGEIPVADRPFVLADGQAAVAAALILGSAKNRLPIVYVSAAFDGGYEVEPEELARLVCGMAHVVVEPSRAFSLQLKSVASGRNVYGGTVGIYWPDSEARSALFVGGNINSKRALHLEIAKKVRIALSNRRQSADCTWLNVKEAVSKKRLELLKANESAELADFIEAFDAEGKVKDARLAEAEIEINRLKAEVKRLSASTVSGGDLLKRGSEIDLYRGEIHDFVLQAVDSALRRSVVDSRRYQVLFDIAEANKQFEGAERIKYELKGLLRSYGGMNSVIKAKLVSLGFEVFEDGKHYKAIFCNDGRYTFILSRSASDHRSGMNLLSDISRVLF